MMSSVAYKVLCANDLVVEWGCRRVSIIRLISKSFHTVLICFGAFHFHGSHNTKQYWSDANHIIHNRLKNNFLCFNRIWIRAHVHVYSFQGIGTKWSSVLSFSAIYTSLEHSNFILSNVLGQYTVIPNLLFSTIPLPIKYFRNEVRWIDHKIAENTLFSVPVPRFVPKAQYMACDTKMIR